MDAVVRMIETRDIPRLAEIEAAADQLLIQRFGPDLFSDVTPGEDRVADPGFVLVAGRPCVGFAHVLEDRGTAHLQQLAVDPAHGRRGLGAALVQACCQQAEQRGYGELTLTTFRDLPFNAPWYARLGFGIIDHPAGVLARHVEQELPYARLAPRIAMSRRLSRSPAAPAILVGMPEDFDPAQLDPDERAEIAAQIPVISAAWRFITPALQDHDLAAAWPAVDPSLRLCWAQAWLDLNRPDAAADGYDLDEVAVVLTDDTPSHPLWRHFSRVLLRDLRGVGRDFDPNTWGIGGNARLLAVDIELLYLQDKTGLEGGVWQPGQARFVVPVVMRLADGQWRVLNFGSETIPTPGWPPTLHE